MIFLGCCFYVFDVDCSFDGFLCLLVINIGDYKMKLEFILFIFLYGRYMVVGSSIDYYCIFVNLVFKVIVLSIFLKIKIWFVYDKKLNLECIINDGYIL